MPLFAWSDEYSVQIPAMDRQHQRLFELINELHDAMLKGQGKERVQSTLAELAQYTRTHFAQEEALMLRHKYPAYATHKAIHDGFVRRVDEMAAQKGGGSLLSMEVMKTLKDWLVQHIQGTDQKYAPFLSEK